MLPVFVSAMNQQMPVLLSSTPVAVQQLKPTGGCSEQLESYLACLAAKDVESTVMLYAPDAVIRVVNQTELSYAVYRGNAGARELSTWLYAILARSDQPAQTAKKLALPANQSVPATSFCAWDCPAAGVTSCSSVCSYNEVGQIVRQNFALDLEALQESDTPPCFTNGEALGKLKPELGSASPSVNASFTHHFSTFGGGVTKDATGNIPNPSSTADEQMKDFAPDAVLSTYCHVADVHSVLHRPSQIHNYFVELYPTFVDASDMDAHIWDIEEPSGRNPGMVFLAFRNPKSGYHSGADTFFFDGNNKIIRQFTIETHDPIVMEEATYGCGSCGFGIC